jgi:hypothetical protein
MIKKREFNPELSTFSNLLLDMVDFRDRVRPLANDLTLMDTASRYQSHTMDELAEARAELMKELKTQSKEQGEITAESEVTDFEGERSSPPHKTAQSEEVDAA